MHRTVEVVLLVRYCLLSIRFVITCIVCGFPYVTIATG
nr:MAG TPA: hypothetical protein [Caudoviricetes sp.]